MPQPPDVSHILPPPFDWCEVPAGWVTIEDVSHRSGTNGGNFYVERFWIAKYPITNAQYRIFEDDENGCLNPVWWNFSPHAAAWRASYPIPTTSAFPGDDLPRTNVCWYEAIAFTCWLNAHLFPLSNMETVQTSNLNSPRPEGEGQGVRVLLPTEQQWQRAAQGDDNRTYPWGSNFDPNRCSVHESGIDHPTPVSKYLNGVSPFGVYDMAGNVWEWCLTEWRTDTIELLGNKNRLLRGGSWGFSHRSARTAFRSSYRPDSRIFNAGFRVACCRSPYDTL